MKSEWWKGIAIILIYGIALRLENSGKGGR
jgi:hypothetical protein